MMVAGVRSEDSQPALAQVLGHSVSAGRSVGVSLTCKHQAVILLITTVTASQVSLAPSRLLNDKRVSVVMPLEIGLHE